MVGHKGRGVRGSSYPLSRIYFESMYSHVYGVKWSPWSVLFEIDYLREGGASYQISLIPCFFRIKFYFIFIKTYIENLTLLYLLLLVFESMYSHVYGVKWSP